MRRRLMAVAVGVVVFTATPADAAQAPTHEGPVAEYRPAGCSKTYTRTMFRRAARGVMTRPRRATRHERRALHRMIRCQRQEGAAREMKGVLARWRSWRQRYPNRWRLAFGREALYWRGWAEGTSNCETSQFVPRGKAAQARAATGNGFYGAFQWVPSTWYDAGGDRFPTAASWHHQAVLAIHYARRHGKQHWPVCGRR